MRLPTRGQAADPALVVVVTAVALVGVWVELRYAVTAVPPAVGAYVLTVVAAAPLLFRRHWPIGAAVACLVVCFAYRAFGYPGFAPAVLVFLACYTLARERGLLHGVAPALVAWIIPALPPHPLALIQYSVSMPAVGMAVVAMIGASNRRRMLDYAARVRESSATAAAQLGQRMAEERLRIAQELHDVLAHTISVIAVQSSVALEALEESPAQAREALLAVRGAAKQAMPELRATLDLLRGGGPSEPKTLPQPGFDELPELIRQARESGLAVELTVAEQLAGASTLIELTAYRIVQEALTNIRKHAAATRAEVRLGRDHDTMTVEVTDDGHGTETPTAGFGLLGMRERVESVGGTLTVGPRVEGGFGVLARLPWIARAAEPPETVAGRVDR